MSAANEEFAARREMSRCRTGDEHQRRNLFGATFFSYEKGGKKESITLKLHPSDQLANPRQ